MKVQQALIIILLAAYANGWCFDRVLSLASTVEEIDYSPDGTKMVLAQSRRVRLYQTVTYTEINSTDHLYTHSNDKIKTAKFSKNGNMLAYAGNINGGSNSDIIIVNPTTSALTFIKDIQTGITDIFELDFNFNNTLIMVCGKSPDKYQIFTIATQALLRQASFGDDVRCCRFASNGQYAVGTKDDKIYTYYVNGGLRWQYTGGKQIYRVQWSSNSAHLISGEQDGMIKLFNISSNSPLRSYNFATHVYALDWSPDQSYIGGGNSNTANSDARFFDGAYPATAAIPMLESFPEPSESTVSARFSYDSQQFAISDKSFKVNIYKRICQRCPVEQYLNGTICNFCALDIIGCRLCNSSSYCFNCTDGFYINTATNRCSTCVSAMKECWACTSNSVCIQCSTNYYLNANQCLSCAATMKGCISCQNSTKCQLCNSNEYYLSVSGQCTSCTTLSNCLYCNSSSICTFCKPSYYLNGGNTCDRCSQNCSMCSALNSCQRCDIGYYLSSTLCQPCPFRCINCTSTTVCSQCAVGYYNTGTNCLNCISPCATCNNTSSYCQSCNVGWYLASAGSCSSCPNTCTACSSLTICLSCRLGHYLNINTCSRCNNLTPFCEECTKLVCVSCSSGYLLNSSNNCTSCRNLLTGCQICSTSSICNICSVQYYLIGNSCFACQSPCLSCYNSTKCQSCITGYYLDAVNYNCLRCPQQCAACSSSSNCITCQIGYFRNSSSSCSACYLTIGNCSICFDSTLCIKCEEGYYWNGILCTLCTSGCSTCINSTNCGNCMVGYYLNGIACAVCSYKCIACSTSATTCTSCSLGYYLSSTNCLKCSDRQNGCLSCNTSICFQCDYELGFYLNSLGSCLKCYDSIPYCYNCNNNNTCINCEITYTLASSTTCVSCSSLISNCLVCYNSTYCTLCNNGHYLYNNNCVQCQNGCQNCITNSFCTKCLTGFIIQANNTCLRCGQFMVGCQLCSSTTNCINCLHGYYLNVNQCVLCSFIMKGCGECNNSSFCLECDSGYYLNSSNSCQSCPSEGCILCNTTLPSQCISCKRGYYIDNNLCKICNITNCDICLNANSCQTCQSGYYFHLGSCVPCIDKFSGCLFCNFTTCLMCKSGFYRNATSQTCYACLIQGCQICNNTVQNQCVTCNSHYYLSASKTCQKCNIAATLMNCELCSSNTVCVLCSQGFYLNSGTTCSNCSSISYGCTNCTAIICSRCMIGFLLNNSLCQFCAHSIHGCSYCHHPALCLQCQQGYYINGSICRQCRDHQGCLLCKDILNCKKCEVGYYLDSNSQCIACNLTLTGCALCQSSGICLVCKGQYQLSGFNCQLITVSAAVQVYNYYPQLSYSTEFISQSLLKHIISVKGGSTFTQTNLNLSQMIQINYVAKGKTNQLVIKYYSWSSDFKHLYLYTNNLFEFSQTSSYLSPMQLFNKRLLNSYSSLTYNTKFQLMISSSALTAILPGMKNNGGAYFIGDTSSPEFIQSLYKTKSFNYYLFGLFVAGYLFIFYAVFMIFVNSKGKGSIISHILYCKMPALTLFPTYLQLINYCSGFMFADLPWLNSYFKQFQDWSQNMPPSYAIFYSSMNISGTYFMPVLFIVLLAFFTFLFYLIFDQHRSRLLEIMQFFYCYFISGLIVSSTINVIGFYQNPMNQITINNLWYIFGLLTFLIIIIHACYLCFKSVNDLWRLRIIIKGILLNIISINAVHLFILVICVQMMFIYIQYKKDNQIQSKNLWLLSNFLVNIPLMLLYLFSHSLVSLYISSLLILITLLLQSILSYRQYKFIRQHEMIKIDQKMLKMQDKHLLTMANYFKSNKVSENREQMHQDIIIPQLMEKKQFEISAINQEEQIQGNNFFTLQQALEQPHSNLKKKNKTFYETD